MTDLVSLIYGKYGIWGWTITEQIRYHNRSSWMDPLTPDYVVLRRADRETLGLAQGKSPGFSMYGHNSAESTMTEKWSFSLFLWVSIGTSWSFLWIQATQSKVPRSRKSPSRIQVVTSQMAPGPWGWTQLMTWRLHWFPYQSSVLQGSCPWHPLHWFLGSMHGVSRAINMQILMSNAEPAR